MDQEIVNPEINTIIEENLFELYSSYGQVPGASVYDAPDMTRIATGQLFSLFNSVLRAGLQPESVLERIEETLTFFESRSLPFMWWIGPSTKPENLGSYLGKYGLTGDSSPGMAAQLDALDEGCLTLNHDLTIKCVETAEELKKWHDIWTTAFEIPKLAGDCRFSIYSSLGFSQDKPWRHYLGLLNGCAVATSFSFLGSKAALFSGGAVLPEARRRGIGTAMLLLAVREAKEMGYRIGISLASDMSLNIFKKLGFKEYCRIEHWISGDLYLKDHS